MVSVLEAEGGREALGSAAQTRRWAGLGVHAGCLGSGAWCTPRSSGISGRGA